MFKFVARMFLSFFLDEEGRAALARRAQVSELDDELKIEQAKTKAIERALAEQKAGKGQAFVAVPGASDQKNGKATASLSAHEDKPAEAEEGGRP